MDRLSHPLFGNVLVDSGILETIQVVGLAQYRVFVFAGQFLVLSAAALSARSFCRVMVVNTRVVVMIYDESSIIFISF